MQITQISKEAFAIIGKQGSTQDGAGFVQKLWEDANSHFAEISALAKRDEAGNLAGVWGAMSDFTLSFAPWETDFTQGLYLAGVECLPDAAPPENWVKWVIPGYDYLCIEVESETTFSEGIRYLREHHLPLAGAVQEFTDPGTGKCCLYFPIANR